MKFSTSMTMLKGVALVAALGLGGWSASAQTFVANGVVWKASGSNVTAQKVDAVITTGQESPGILVNDSLFYAGDIVIPATVEYNGKNYKVTSIGGVFKGSKITSVEVADGIATVSRGCFQNCYELKSAKLPSDLVTWNGDLFKNCVLLEEFTIGGKAKEVASSQFAGCSSLRKITIEDGATPIELSAAAFGGNTALVEVVLNRALGTKYTDMATKPWRSNSAVTSVTIGGSFTDIPASYFEGAKNLKTVTFTNQPTAFGTNCFAGTALEEMTLPETITNIPTSCFDGCKSLKKVTLGSAVTGIDPMAFRNCAALNEINLPDGIANIGQMAFSNTALTGELTLPAALKNIGQQAFAKCVNLTAVNLPATTATIGAGAFYGSSNLAKFAIDGANENFKTYAEGSAIATADGKKLVVVAPGTPLTSLSGDFEELAGYAAYMTGLENVDFPNCTVWGDYSLYGTKIKSLAVSGTVGRYVAANCANLESLTITGQEVPFGIAMSCPALTGVTLTEAVTSVKQDAFNGCTSLKTLDLGTLLSILEGDCFKGSGLETLTVGAANPAGMTQGVFTAESSNITLKVPVEYVNAYKNAAGWKYLNVVGDANVAAGPADMGMPAGLYYATPDGKLNCYYSDGQSDSYDVGNVLHTFQLAQFKNRIYGASAGKGFVYSATGATDGDGKLFYISQVGGKTFQAVVLDNAGNNAYKDPFGLSIYGDTLFVNDRNVCIRKISADAIALPQDYASWVENNWLGFYGAQWSYGCIKSGWAITQSENDKGDPEPLYWVGMKYNGNGIYRFKDSDIGNSSKPGAMPANGAFLNACGPIFTTFYLDEKNNQIYVYMEICGNADKLTKGGLYRIDIDKLEAQPEPACLEDLGAQLIDGSPVKFEGAGANEHVGISQLTPDEKGEYLYWCYRAPSESEAASTEGNTDYAKMRESNHYWWADKFDAANPLHQTGIKRIKLGEANPVVEMVAPGAEGYGVVPVNYEGSVKPAGVEDVIVAENATPAIVYNNGLITATLGAADVTVYDMTGAIVAVANLGAGESMNVADLAKGAYIAAAGKTVVKFVK